MEKKVIVTKPVIGICHMQVCACKNATDDEILEVCNSENPAGTSNGWSEVIRKQPDGFWGEGANLAPVQCSDDPERLHILVAC